ncbi:MAG: threo-3-hydroxy-L-aspartate ammonia-lyase [Gemmatimonadota bacterium]|jgi:threonine dehydratase|nr:threo-3-hydroxy-L-aspartate ammonia-lyase [Gemmatimonadota bacterium]
MRPPTFDDILAARARLAGVAHRTPVLTSRQLDARVGARVFLKAEHLQRIGAFKFRGGYNALAAMAPEDRARGVVAFSSGNHAQAVALAARLFGVPATIVMPHNAPASKLAATEGYGARVVRYDPSEASREVLARQLVAETGATLVPPFDHPDVIAGQGTAAAELFEDVGPLDVVVACVGGGGLLSGTALAAAGMAPACRVWGVEPALGDDVTRSFDTGTLVALPGVPATIADGARTISASELTLALILRHVHGMATVPDEALLEAMRFVMLRMKQVVEPSGVLALAGVLTGVVPVPPGGRVGVIVSGGNVDAEMLVRALSG